MANRIHRTMIGGQAVIEGVMMRGVDKTAMAVRTPDGEIALEVWDTVSVRDRSPILRLPLIRGVVNFAEMLIYGYKTISKSAALAEGSPSEIADEKSAVPDAGTPAESTPAESSPNALAEGENAQPEATPAESSPNEIAEGESAQPEATPAEGSPNEIEDEISAVPEAGTPAPAQSSPNEIAEGENAQPEASIPAAAAENGAGETGEKKDKDGSGVMDAVTAGSMVLGLVIAVFLFSVLPTLLIGKTDPIVHWGQFRTLVEGVLKIVIFVIYLAAVSMMKDIQRVYQYHGAEHKTIYCYEHGDELTPENARKYTRFHPRCGTSFLLIVLIIGIILFSFVTWNTLWLRIVLKIVLLPVVIGVSYEIIKFAGRHDNSVMRFLLAPGLWLQRLTTREPDLTQLEVAIQSIKAVLPDNPNDDRW